MKFETLAVHAGAEPDATGAMAPPLYLATTFEHAPDGNRADGLNYQRADNPTQRRLEAALAALDGGAAALFFSSGVAAGACLLQSLPQAGHVLVQEDLYHGFRDQIETFFPRWGLRHDFVDMTDTGAVRAALRDDTRLLWAESPSNPLMQVIDIAALAELAHAGGARLLVDNTFATPALQQPLALGADIVLHSATKYMGGHSDVMGGVLVFAAADEWATASRTTRTMLGFNASPFNAWMILRGLRSLPARMDWHCRNARALAEFLAGHARVEAVHYPGLASHPQHALAQRQMRDFGGMLSVRVRGGREAALAVASRLKVFTNATSLGGCESLVEHRASIEGPHPHSPQDLLRLSVGVEHADDLIADWAQALA
ncbi:MAG TPA: PLP-dependent transferase [Rhodanobacteraceae bacterium]|nr:PLP-dependent transferase [Rhodanobacteraceae bacterium]